MEPLASFFKKFKNLKAPERDVQYAVVHALEEIVGVTIDPKQIVINRDTLVLKVSSVIKSEIKLHESEVLERIHTNLGISSARFTALR